MDQKPDNRLREMRATFDLGGAPDMSSSKRLVPAKPLRAKVFKSGNSLALRLPKALGLEAGMEMELTALPGGGYSLAPAAGPRRKINVDAFWGICPDLKPLTDEEREWEQSPRPWDDPDWPGWVEEEA